MTRIGILLMLAAVTIVAGCANAPSSGATGPKSPNQLKQQELAGMEKVGQRNDFDAPYAPKP
jgi:hypothetical protein